MKDVLDELAAAHRAMGKGSVPAGDAYTIEVRRRYEAPIDDVWDAITSPERLHRCIGALPCCRRQATSPSVWSAQATPSARRRYRGASCRLRS